MDKQDNSLEGMQQRAEGWHGKRPPHRTPVSRLDQQEAARAVTKEPSTLQKMAARARAWAGKPSVPLVTPSQIDALTAENKRLSDDRLRQQLVVTSLTQEIGKLTRMAIGIEQRIDEQNSELDDATEAISAVAGTPGPVGDRGTGIVGKGDLRSNHDGTEFYSSYHGPFAGHVWRDPTANTENVEIKRGPCYVGIEQDDEAEVWWPSISSDQTVAIDTSNPEVYVYFEVKMDSGTTLNMSSVKQSATLPMQVQGIQCRVFGKAYCDTTAGRIRAWEQWQWGPLYLYTYVVMTEGCGFLRHCSLQIGGDGWALPPCPIPSSMITP